MPGAGKGHPLLSKHVHAADGRGMLAAVAASDIAADPSSVALVSKQRRTLRQYLLEVRIFHSADSRGDKQ